MRNIYSPDVRVANELMVDSRWRKLGKDPLEFRLRFVRDERVRAVLEKVAEEGNWGRTMPAGTAQGIAIHKEYKGATACLVEIDCRPETVNRQVRERRHRAPGHQGCVRRRRRAGDQPARARGADAWAASWTASP